MFKNKAIQFLKFFLLWIGIFNFERLLFIIHQWYKVKHIPFKELALSFYHGIYLDIATASYLTIIPFLLLQSYLFFHKKWLKILFKSVIILFFGIVAAIHAGEINAYTEWNHKLTTRVFMHLSNPDEVVRSADYSMTFWFFIYFTIELVFSIKTFNYLFSNILTNKSSNNENLIKSSSKNLIFIGLFIILLRGGFQSIPININAAIYSNHTQANDIAINSSFYFMSSFLLYNRSDIQEILPKVDATFSKTFISDLYTDVNKDNSIYILKNKRPNIVFVILESWAAEAMGCLSKNKSATPNFDKLAKEGVLFSNIYATSHTSEIGNASIFSGFPGVPEVSISLQPEKSRKIKSLNQFLDNYHYSSNYLFSGDLKYGNIGGFFLDHNFKSIKDEKDFPKTKRGKLNYFDEDLYKFFLKDINKTIEPFLHCAFTGSTHSPFDIPKKIKTFTGVEKDYMNSMVYADQCLYDFIQNCREQNWYKNTLFVFVADHGHTAPEVQSPNDSKMYRIPLLLYGDVLKNEYKGLEIKKLFSQIDISYSLLKQMGIDTGASFPFSRNLFSNNCKEYVLHTVIRGYTWKHKEEQNTYYFEMKKYLDNTFKNKTQGEKESAAFVNKIYEYYKNL